MNTRRRLLTGLSALGLLPSAAMADVTKNDEMLMCDAKYPADSLVNGLRVWMEAELDKTPRKAGASFKLMSLPGRVSTPFLPAKTQLSDIPLSTLQLEWDGGSVSGLIPKSINVGVTNFGFDLKAPGLEWTQYGGANVSSILIDIVLRFSDRYMLKMKTKASSFDKGQEYTGSVTIGQAYESGEMDGFRSGTIKEVLEVWKREGSLTIEAYLHGDDVRAFVSEPIPFPNAIIETQLPKLKDEVWSKFNAGQCRKVRRTPDCFLTTAAVQTVGLPDNCAELTSLRAFRDGPLRQMAGGNELIEAYYERAPDIVASIQARPDAVLIWHRTYLFGVLPCAVLARLGFHQIARRLYMCMTHRLAKLALD